MTPTRSLLASISISASVSLSLAACGGGGETGSLQVFITAEDSIPNGVAAGTGADQIVDGWTVSYDQFLFAFGDFTMARSSDPDDVRRLPGTTILDLTNLPSGGHTLGELTDLDAERWDRVGYSAKRGVVGATIPPSTAPADAAFLTTNGWSLYVAGTLTKPGGQSCLPTAPTSCVTAETITFAFGLDAATSFADCATPGGDAGVAIPSGGTAQVRPTIHGDHWFFTNITQGAEVTERRAQWLADADLDRNGGVDLAELARSQAADLFPTPTYSITGAVIPVVTGADFFEAQARTLGDFNGEGECPTRAVIP